MYTRTYTYACLFSFVIFCFMNSSTNSFCFILLFLLSTFCTTESLSQTIFSSANASNYSCQRSWRGGHGLPHIWVCSHPVPFLFPFFHNIFCLCLCLFLFLSIWVQYEFPCELMNCSYSSLSSHLFILICLDKLLYFFSST
jgi:hypothetical protein